MLGEKSGSPWLPKLPAQPHQIIVTGLKHNIGLLFQSYRWSVSIATSSIIEPRPNMYPVERNSQDKLESTFPKKGMSLFLVSHNTKITLVWAQKGVKINIWAVICTSTHGPVCYLIIVLWRRGGAPYTSQKVLESHILTHLGNWCHTLEMFPE